MFEDLFVDRSTIARFGRRQTPSRRGRPHAPRHPGDPPTGGSRQSPGALRRPLPSADPHRGSAQARSRLRLPITI